MESRSHRKPPWVRVPRAGGPHLGRVRRALEAHRLGTVCDEARCPNRAECWGSGTATFLVLGRLCTRSCRFCSVRSGRPAGSVDEDEPERVAAAAEELGLRYVVLTSVSRDDLADGGAAHYARTVRLVRERCGGRAMVEVLTPDYLGEPLRAVLDARPTVLAHNVETVREVTAQVRDPRCSYDRSLQVLTEARRLAPRITTKSSLLLGLGETDGQVESALDDLRGCDVDLVCIGQYLRPTRESVAVARYVPPERFAELGELARAKGFRGVASGPLVRTSHRAAQLAAEASRGLDDA